MRTPDFLRIAPEAQINQTRDQRQIEDYAPLLGIWLIDIAFALRLPQQVNTLEQIFSDDDFIQVCGLPELQEVFAHVARQDRDLPDFLRRFGGISQCGGFAASAGAGIGRQAGEWAGDWVLRFLNQEVKHEHNSNTPARRAPCGIFHCIWTNAECASQTKPSGLLIWIF